MNENEERLRKNIGKKIKIARKNINYTQEKLAEKSSLSTRFISQIERGISFGSASTIVNLCKTLNISPDFLFTDTIQVSSPEFSNFIDNDFLNNYCKLNEYNKQVINRLTNDLINLQEEKNSKAN